MKTKIFTIKDIEQAVKELNEKDKFECSSRQLLIYLQGKYKRKK